MKKLILALLMVMLLVGVGFAAPKWVPRQYFTTDQQITTSNTIFYDMEIYWSGLTVGARLDLRNGTTTAATKFYTFVAATANGTHSYEPHKALTIDGGIYFDPTITAGIIGISVNYQD